MVSMKHKKKTPNKKGKAKRERERMQLDELREISNLNELNPCANTEHNECDHHYIKPIYVLTRE